MKRIVILAISAILVANTFAQEQKKECAAFAQEQKKECNGGKQLSKEERVEFDIANMRRSWMSCLRKMSLRASARKAKT